MTNLPKIVQKHFDMMSEVELKLNLYDQKQQLSLIAGSDSATADYKRKELNARIEYINSRLKDM